VEPACVELVLFTTSLLRLPTYSATFLCPSSSKNKFLCIVIFILCPGCRWRRRSWSNRSFFNEFSVVKKNFKKKKSSILVLRVRRPPRTFYPNIITLVFLFFYFFFIIDGIFTTSDASVSVFHYSMHQFQNAYYQVNDNKKKFSIFIYSSSNTEYCVFLYAVILFFVRNLSLRYLKYL